MIETPDKPVSQIVITFAGADNMQPGLRAENISPAQFASAVALLNLMCQSAWSQAIAQAQAAGIVRAPAGALGNLSPIAPLNRQGRRHA